MAGYAPSFRHPSVRPAPSSQHHAPPPFLNLPNGPCSFRDLSSGRDTCTCGCKHFILNHAGQQSHQTANAGALLPTMETAWCFCGHHACFHDYQSTSSSMMPPAPQLAGNTQYIQCPGSQLAPPVQGYAGTSGLGLIMDQSQFGHAKAMGYPTILQPGPFSSPNLPSTRQNSMAPSENTSLQGGRSRHAPGRGFHDHVSRMRQQNPHIDTATHHAPVTDEDYIQSATEVATPSNCGTPVLRGADDAVECVKACLDGLNSQLQTACGALSPRHMLTNLEQVGEDPEAGDAIPNTPPKPSQVNIADLVAKIQTLQHILTARPGFYSSISDLGQRIDALETMSFSHMSVEEVHDRFEQFDGRILELEQRVEEFESLRAAHEDREALRRQGRRAADVSFDSTMSEAGEEPPLLGSKRHTIERLHTLEHRLADLETTASPSARHPWDVEVVLLPWGPDLTGMWFDDLEASQGSRTSTQEASRASHADTNQRARSTTPKDIHSRSASRNQAIMEWSGMDAKLMSPRACGATSGSGGRVYQRLKSRGFVRNLSIIANDARAVHSSICAAFDDLLAPGPAASSLVHHPTGIQNELFGLRSTFIPLRKIHKSSCLRFLSCAELTTPVLWTASFLESDVIMKAPQAGLRRLFITSPEAYLQRSDSLCWSWQKMRELPRFDPLVSGDIHAGSGSGNAEVLEGDAREDCWAWDAKLDPPKSQHSSFDSSGSFKPGSSFISSHPLSPENTHYSSSHANSDDGPEELSSRPSRVGHQAPITPISELAPATMRRTVSMPSTVPLGVSTAAQQAPKRQVTSFNHGPSVHPTTLTKAQMKRRRLSKTPDDLAASVRGTFALTPRRSREPGSPSGLSSQPAPAYATRAAVKRGTTPMAYATPFSNSFHGGFPEGGDTDMDVSEDEDEEHVDEDEEFQGIEDVEDQSFDEATMMEEDAWEGVGGDTSVDEDDDDDDDDSDFKIDNVEDESER